MMLLVMWVLVVMVLLVHVGWVLLHGGLVDLKHWVKVCEGVHRKMHLGHWGDRSQRRQRRHGRALVGWRVNRRHVMIVRDLDVERVTHVSVHERSINHFTAPESRAADHGMLFSVVLG